MRLLIDTDLLIDAARGASVAIERLQDTSRDYDQYVSIVSYMELIVGCRNKAEIRLVERFITHFQTIDIDEDISQQSLRLLKKYRLSHGLLIADSMIAATALSLDSLLATRNLKDYRFIENLKLLGEPS